MSAPHTVYQSGPTIDVSSSSNGRRGLKEKIGDHFRNGIEKSADGINDILTGASIFVIAALIGAGAVGYFGWRWMDTIVHEKEMAYERKMQTVSFNTFTNELAKIDPEEKKDFVTSKTICSDAAIKGNPEADMLTVCMNDFYWRKKKSRSQIAQGNQ